MGLFVFVYLDLEQCVFGRQNMSYLLYSYRSRLEKDPVDSAAGGEIVKLHNTENTYIDVAD